MKYHLYSYHMDGGLYFSNTKLEDELLYCDICEDNDYYYGEFETLDEMKEILGADLDMYREEYVLEVFAYCQEELN